MTGYIYLASPYSPPKGHPDPEGLKQWRFEAVCKAAAWLMERGDVVVSPIAHSHPVEQIGLRRTETGEFWKWQDQPLLDAAERVIVLCLPGWNESKGIAHEVAEAKRMGKDVDYLHPEEVPRIGDYDATPALPRTGSVLDAAKALVHGDRGADYGHPLDDFACTAAMWNAYLARRGIPVTLKPEDVGLMMVMVKLSREAGRHKDDNLIDGAGYFETVAMVLDEKMRRQTLVETFGPVA